MPEHRKYCMVGGRLRREISSKLDSILNQENLTAADISKKFKLLGFKSNTQAHQIICSFRKGFTTSNNGPSARDKSFNAPDLYSLAQIFYHLNVPTTDPLITKIQEYDSRFKYPPSFTPEQADVLDYQI